MSEWKSVILYGAADIERVCGVYEVTELTQVPGGRFKIKVLECREGDYPYVAVTNVCFKTPDGAPDGRSGFGRSEVEALQNALKYFMEDLQKRGDVGPDAFYWVNPETF